MSLRFHSPERDELRLAARRGAAETAWVLLFTDAILLGCASLYWMVRGRFFDPGFYEAVSAGALAGPGWLSSSVELLTAAGVRLAGFLGLIASIFVGAVAATSFRRGERWSWYVMWSLPLLATLDFALLAGYGALTPISLTWDAGVLMLSLLPLIATASTFFAERH